MTGNRAPDVTVTGSTVTGSTQSDMLDRFVMEAQANDRSPKYLVCEDDLTE